MQIMNFRVSYIILENIKPSDKKHISETENRNVLLFLSYLNYIVKYSRHFLADL